MIDSLSDKKKALILWIGYVISIVLLIVQIVISLSPASDSESELFAVATIIIFIGVINIILLIFETILFLKWQANMSGKGKKMIGITLRILVLIPVVLLTVLWLVGIFKY